MKSIGARKNNIFIMSSLSEKISEIAPYIGETPLYRLPAENIELYGKLEYFNLTGSVKDRAAYNILTSAIREGKIDEQTTIIESSSGNFALSLATICRHLGLKFIAVIDPNINGLNEQKIRELASGVVKVTDRDATGGFLLSRIRYIEEVMRTEQNVYWTNQYDNPDNFKGYYMTLGPEIIRELPVLDYVFVAVSSGGTITGLSKSLKEHYKNLTVVAVDVEGSVIFGSMPKRRHISGIGSSKASSILQHAIIDDVCIVSEPDIVRGANSLYEEHNIFAGGSSGAVWFAIREYFRHCNFSRRPVVAFVCPDHGESYRNTIYNANWVAAGLI
jgi:cysteine synthase A